MSAVFSGSCYCATTKTGKPAGCACVSIRDGEWGPRIVESPPEPRGDGRYLAAALDRAHQEAYRAAHAGPPAGARVAHNRAEDARGHAHEATGDGAALRAAHDRAEREARAEVREGAPACATFRR